MLKKNFIALICATLMLPAIAADTTTPSPDPTAVKAALNSIFSLLLDDDSGTTTTPPGGGTGGSGGTGGASLPGQITLANFSTPHLNDPEAGTLEGALGVSNSGAATYDISLVVPPGSAGVQPSLTLNYSSSAPNGIVGLGWSLGGLSSFNRCAKTIAQDGVNDRIGFTTADRLCLDGQRLVLVNKPLSDDNYWSEGAEYRTELESFSRITALGSIGARTFRVEMKDGRIMTYGGNSATVAVVVQPVQSGEYAVQPNAGSKLGAQSWAIGRIEDRVGNYIRFEYRQDMTSGEHRPAVIRYGGMGSSGPNPAHAAVRFSYDDDKRIDKWKRYLDETRMDLVSRLNGVITYVGENLDGAVSNGSVPDGWREVRRYNLAYTASLSSGRSLLKSVEVCARGVCLPKTEFDWGQPDPSKAAGFAYIGNWAGAPILTTNNVRGGYWSTNHADYFAFSDIDNDGFTDVLEKRRASAVPDDMGTNDGQIREYTNPIAPGTLFSEYSYYRNTGGAGSGFSRYSYGLNTGEPFVVLDVGDFNGDGALDILARTASESKICLSPLGAGAMPGAPGSKFTFNCNSGLAAKGENTTRAQPYVLDIVGDGRSSHYVPIYSTNKAFLCVGISCVEDTDPPLHVLNNSYSNPAARIVDTLNYVSITQMVDFAGVGQPYDTRWSNPYLVQPVDTDGTPMESYWINERPRVFITGFRRPGEALKQVADYVYPEIPCIAPIESCKWYMFDRPYEGAGLTADFNGSGYTSMVFGYIEENRSTGSAYKKAETTLCLSTGRALDCDVRKKYSGTRTETTGDTGYSVIHAVGDFVGDGMPGILVEKLSYATRNPQRTGQLQMCRVIGNATSPDKSDSAMFCSDWAGPGLPYPDDSRAAKDQVYFMDLLGTGRMQMVKYRSGKYINNVWVEDGRWEIYAPVDVAVAGQALDRLYRVTNGLGAVSKVEYSETGVVSSSGAVYSYPVQRKPHLGKIVSRITHSNGANVSRSSTYAYQDYAFNMHGRGTMAFGRVIATDVENGIVTTKEFSQSWPQIGQMLSERVEGNGVTLSKTVNQLKFQSIAQSNGASTTFPYLYQSVVDRMDWSGAELGRVTTTNCFECAAGDAYGNLKRVEAVSEGGGNRFVATTETTYRDDAGKWLIGLPVATSLTRSSTVEGVTSTEVRKVRHEYDNTNGLLVKDIVEPDAVGDERDLYRVEVDYIRSGNSYGLVKEKRETWKDRNSGQMLTRTVSDTSYDAKGRFPSTIKNALGHVVSHGYDEATGAKVSLKGPNGLDTNWVVDGFGRTKSETRADGTRLENYFKRCIGDCPNGARLVQIAQTFNGSARTAAPILSYSDAQNRVVTTETWGFDASRIRADRDYDNQGRLNEVFKPAYISQPKYSDVRYVYDGLGRVKYVYRRDEVGAATETRTDYYGYRTVETNAKGHTRIVDKDVLGQIRSVQDPNGTVTRFSYDAFANLVKTTDPVGNVINVTYDRLGRKTDLRDPDLGWIHYDVDALGRVWKQVSPNQRALGQSTRTEYDLLNRISGRYESDLESHWVYDTATNGVGLLAEAYTGTPLKKDYKRVHEYYVLGLPKQVTLTLTDGVYRQVSEYDSWNRTSALVYQRNSDAVKRFDLRYNSMGYLSSIDRDGRALWSATKQDAANRVTHAKLGNDLSQTKVFNPFTDSLTSIQSTAAGARRIEVAYEYDKLRNVTKRTQYWETAGFSEDFGYDVMNRVERSKLQSQEEQRFTYNDDGSIATKTGVGTYVYPAPGAGVARPHAVSSIAGIGDFRYDDNGNLLSGAGRTTTWTSFDMPKKISDATDTSEFIYGPEHQRVRQDRGDGSVIIYAGAQEVVKTGTNVTVKTYWPNGVGLEIDRPGTPTELLWSHVDHLGSVIALTDGTGNVKERMAYDVWGKWRRLNPDGTPKSMENMLDHRGFTGHEMLEQLDLVHMNGRIYDPMLGKFLSGDPFIQDPVDGRNYNRYSYVLNNPLNMTDPTGFVHTGSNAFECKNRIYCYVVYQAPDVKGDGGGASALKDKKGNAVLSEQNSEPNLGSSSSTTRSFSDRVDQTIDHNGIPVVMQSGRWNVENHQQHLTADQWFSEWQRFNFIEYLARDAGASKRQAQWIGFAGTLALNSKQFFMRSPSGLTSLTRNCSCCFSAGTPVMTANGEMPIESVKIGQLVYARNEVTGKTELKPVTRLIVTEQKQLYELITQSSLHVVERIEVTDNHPFWVNGLGWVDSGKLEAGMELNDINGESLVVLTLRKLGRIESTYNLTVADFHTYFAGKQKAFVHNCGCIPEGMEVFKNLAEKFGSGYESIAVAQGTHLPIDIGNKLNSISEGVWSKVYEAGMLNGQKVEVHYFYNAIKDIYVNPFIKMGEWGSKAFKTLKGDFP